jgi:hypothetical protein
MRNHGDIIVHKGRPTGVISWTACLAHFIFSLFTSSAREVGLGIVQINREDVS